MIRAPSTLLAASLLLVSACGTETGNGLVTIKTGVAALQAGTDAQGTAFTITSARGSLRHVEFQRPGGKDCAGFGSSNNERVKCDGGKIRINGPMIADLVAKTTMPDLGMIEIPPDTYKRIDVRFEKARAADGVIGAGDPLDTNTLIIEGTIAYPMGSSTIFDMTLAFDEDARFESADGIVIEASTTPQDVLLELDPATWFTTVPVTQCIQNGELVIQNGRVRIEDQPGNTCNGLENAVRDTIKNSGRLKRGNN